MEIALDGSERRLGKRLDRISGAVVVVALSLGAGFGLFDSRASFVAIAVVLGWTQLVGT